MMRIHHSKAQSVALLLHNYEVAIDRKIIQNVDLFVNLGGCCRNDTYDRDRLLPRL
jgi:hypothetical protein